MGFFKQMLGGISRDRKIRQLKAQFERDHPGERMRATLEGYCGAGMMVAQSINEGTSDRLRYLDAYEQELSRESESHRPFAEQAYQIGVETILET